MKNCFLINMLFVLGFWSVSNGLFAQNEVFNEGNELYNQGDYQTAIEKYKAILNSNQHSAELYYNLGNAYMKTEQLGPAIYYFEKARRLAPADEDVLNNLAYAQNQVIDVITPVPQVGFSFFIRQLAGYFSVYQWSVLSVVFAFALGVFYLIYSFSAGSFRKRVFFTLFLLSIFGMVASVSFAFVENDFQKNYKEAIIFALEAQVKSEPTESGQPIFLLHEGTKVVVNEKVDNWIKIKLADGKVGWMEQSALEIL